MNAVPTARSTLRGLGRSLSGRANGGSVHCTGQPCNKKIKKMKNSNSIELSETTTLLDSDPNDQSKISELQENLYFSLGSFGAVVKPVTITVVIARLFSEQ